MNGQAFVEKGENSTHDQLVITDEEEVDELLEAVDRGGRDAVGEYLENHVEATSPMVKHFSTHTDFQTGRAVTIDYDVLDDLREMTFEGIHDA